MRTALVLALVVATGCSVPDVAFYGGDATAEGSSFDSGADTAQEDMDATAAEDAGDASDGGQDGPYDGPSYCFGEPPPDGGTCCSAGSSGGPCFGNCNTQGCSACSADASCTSPSVCCTSGKAGVCQLPPCP